MITTGAENEDRIGKFTASRISDLLVSGDGKTRQNYIHDIASEVFGIKAEITTKAMEHGKANQLDGFEYARQIDDRLKSAKWFDEFIAINDKCGASPDVLGAGFTADVKCQYSIYNYIEQCENTNKKYYLQVQMQMMAYKVDIGYLINYLTRPYEYGIELPEYPFPLKERIFVKEIKIDEEAVDNILKAVDTHYQSIDICLQKMRNAEVLDEIDFFISMKTDKIKYLKHKDINWIKDDRRLYLVNNTFYVVK